MDVSQYFTHLFLIRVILHSCSPTSIDLKYKIKEISAGHDNSAILTTDGKVFGCGSNGFNKLGLGEISCVTRFVELTNIPKIIKHVFLGVCHTIMVTESGDIIYLGTNMEEQSGNSKYFNSIKPQLMSINSTRIIVSDLN